MKSALPPQKKNKNNPRPLKGDILWTRFFLQKERIFPGAHKSGVAISGPRIADKNFTDTRIFLEMSSTKGVVWAELRRSVKSLLNWFLRVGSEMELHRPRIHDASDA